MTLPFLLEDGLFDAPQWLSTCSPFWNCTEPDQLPLVVDCTAEVLVELIRVIEEASWEHCTRVEQVQQLAQRYQIQLPDFMPLFLQDLQPIGATEQSAEQLLESLFVADDVLLQVYSDEPLLKVGIQALLIANQVQALVQRGLIALENELPPLIASQPKPLHPLLQSRLQLLAESVYNDPTYSDIRKSFFRILGSV